MKGPRGAHATRVFETPALYLKKYPPLFSAALEICVGNMMSFLSLLLFVTGFLFSY